MSAKQLGANFEAMIVKATGWQFLNGNGYDFRPRGIPVEARCRTLGTDGSIPRISVNAMKVNTSKVLIAAHFDRRGRLVSAILVPMATIKPLYDRYRQKGSRGQAHLPWRKLAACNGAREITSWLSR